ncbi:hypothetical protein [Kangiella sediminilitoris]|uniref:Lipoprotein n=1 Tax=Kangiella sediminilitoris TaxID=1144748 RepID=A0A1B3BC13_9GAMM|nr:hypothetical protein [Kangiella sediminilitoris]AOE50323.1 hypothetical protein KS2013_1613 [Kangiella sediminilitoris]
MKYITLLLALFMTACATTTNNTNQTAEKSAAGTEKAAEADSDQIQQELKEAFVVDIMRMKIKENGENIACKLEAFTSCWGVSEQQCLDDAQPVKTQCLEFAETKFPSPSSEQAVKQYAQVFSMCMITRQSLLYPSKLSEMKTCLNQFDKPDPQKIAESILNPGK